jgi:REP element-mobilizing transposase RayT
MSEIFKNKYRINTTRAPWWDYGDNGRYFITICTSNREYYFGKIIGGEMQLSDIGERATRSWIQIPEHFPFAKLDEFVIMPNHIHGIIIIAKSDLKFELNKMRESIESKSKNKFGPQSNNLASIIRGFKIGVTIFCNKKKYLFGWQSRYYDHIIRDDDELNRIRSYIMNNPANWTDDEHFVL